MIAGIIFGPGYDDWADWAALAVVLLLLLFLAVGVFVGRTTRR